MGNPLASALCRATPATEMDAHETDRQQAQYLEAQNQELQSQNSTKKTGSSEAHNGGEARKKEDTRNQVEDRTQPPADNLADIVPQMAAPILAANHAHAQTAMAGRREIGTREIDAQATGAEAGRMRTSTVAASRSRAAGGPDGTVSAGGLRAAPYTHAGPEVIRANNGGDVDEEVAREQVGEPTQRSGQLGAAGAETASGQAAQAASSASISDRALTSTAGSAAQAADAGQIANGFGANADGAAAMGGDLARNSARDSNHESGAASRPARSQSGGDAAGGSALRENGGIAIAPGAGGVAFQEENPAHGMRAQAAKASAAGPAAAGRDAFAVLDGQAGAHGPAGNSGSPNGGTSWIHAGAQHAEAGFEDPALGWVSVRAEMGAGGIHAAIVPGTANAAQALSGHMAGLSAHLAEQRVAVSSLSMASSQLAADAGQSGGQQQARQGQDSPAQSDPQPDALLPTQRQTAMPSALTTAQWAKTPPSVAAQDSSGRHISVIA